MKKMIRVGILLLATPGLSGCWLLAVGGAGAYGGYKMKEEGYTLQNPVKKEAPAEAPAESSSKPAISSAAPRSAPTHLSNSLEVMGQA